MKKADEQPSLVGRCTACGRPVAMRWRQCPFCKQATGAPWFAQYPFLDRSLNSYRAFTLGVVVWLFVGAAFLWVLDWREGAVAFAAGMLGLSLAITTPWLPIAWKTSLWFWPSLALVAAVSLGWRWAACWALLLLGPTVWMVVRQRDLLARLEGREPLGRLPKSEVPKWTPCRWCGSRDAQLVAPLYCVSLLAVTLRFPGTFESFCERHARLVALPAMLTSTLLGWWGVPWGPVWTIDVLARNLEGGVTLDADLIKDLQRREALEGGVDKETPLTDFIFGLVFGLVPFVVVSLFGPWSASG